MAKSFLAWLGTLLLITLGACIQASSPEAFLHVNGYRTHMPIYIQIDEAFSSEQNTEIYRAAKTWEQASSDIIKFNLDFNHSRPTLFFQDDDINNQGAHFIYYGERSYQELGWDQYFKHPTALALTYYSNVPDHNKEDRVKIIAFNLDKKYDFSAVMLHELGHSLGLVHTDDKISVMHSTVLTKCITPADAEQLCQLYRCIPKPQCLQNVDINLPEIK